MNILAENAWNGHKGPLNKWTLPGKSIIVEGNNGAFRGKFFIFWLWEHFESLWARKYSTNILSSDIRASRFTSIRLSAYEGHCRRVGERWELADVRTHSPRPRQGIFQETFYVFVLHFTSFGKFISADRPLVRAHYMTGSRLRGVGHKFWNGIKSSMRIRVRWLCSSVQASLSY